MKTYKIKKADSVYEKAYTAHIYDESGKEIYSITHCGNKASSAEEVYQATKRRAEEYIVFGE